MKACFFRNPNHFRKWLEGNHLKEKELLVGYYKKGAGKTSITWPESVEQTLCFGWIDGVRRSIDHESYCIRFTPRKVKSIWSAVNLKKIEELITQNLVYPAGIEIYKNRDLKKANLYSFEQEKEPELSTNYLKKFKVNKSAFNWFMALAPSYRKASIHWVMSARQEKTRERRLQELIVDSGNRLRIKSMRR